MWRHRAIKNYCSMSKIIIEIPGWDCHVNGLVVFEDRFGKRLCPPLEIDSSFVPGQVSTFELCRPLEYGEIVGPFRPDYEKN